MRILRAGPLTLRYDGGDLRYVRLGDHEVIRRVYAALRDHNWGTVPMSLSDEEVSEKADSFRVRYAAAHRQGEIDFRWDAEITGQADGAISFAFDGQALSTFRRNRIGFCVLHPIRECAGARCRALYTNGTSVELRFPEVIAAEQPVRWLHDLTGLAHEIEPGLWAELRFAGDAFEMEDQRNWIDASFKTFCTPLRLPFPMTIEAGTRVTQKVTLRVLDERPKRAAKRARPADRPVDVAVSETPVPLPAIGLGASSLPGPLRAEEVAILKLARWEHLRFDLTPADGSALEAAFTQAAALEAKVELALHLAPEPASGLASFAKRLRPFAGELSRVLIYHQGQRSTTALALSAARKALAKSLGDDRLAVGTNGDLYQLNLQRPPGEAGAICWSMNPQVHASDDASVLETPEAAAAQVDSVRRYFPARALIVSPITLRPRFNPNATGPEPETPPGQLPRQVDPRQATLLGAVWTAAMLKYLAEARADSLTFFETVGWRGLMEREPLLPDLFPSFPDAVFPLFHPLADFTEMRGGQAFSAESSRPLEAAVLMLKKGRKRRIIAANLRAQPTRVNLGMTGPGKIRRLNETTMEEAMREPRRWRTGWMDWRGPVLELLPHEVATVDA